MQKRRHTKNKAENLVKSRLSALFVARQKELESPTFRLGGGRSIQLSYWRIFNFKGDRPSGGERSWFS